MGEVYIPAAQHEEGVDVDFVCGGWGAESEPRKKRGWPEISRSKVRCQHSTSNNDERVNKRLLTLLNDLPKCFAIIRVLGNRFAVVPRLPSPVVYGQCEVVCGDCTAYGWT